MSKNSDRQWYCIELVDVPGGVHSILSLFTTEARASDVLHTANARLPQEVEIYYWRSEERPVSRPQAGYTDGPMAQPSGPSQD